MPLTERQLATIVMLGIGAALMVIGFITKPLSDIMGDALMFAGGIGIAMTTLSATLAWMEPQPLEEKPDPILSTDMSDVTPKE